MKNNFDIVIIWAGAAGLFGAINISKDFSKLILEKNPKPWVKVLLSGWERANVSNIDIEPERDYFGQNKKALKSIFARCNQWDIMAWFSENRINIVEEDRWRLILESWNSKELLNILVKKAKENNSEIICNSEVVKIKHSLIPSSFLRMEENKEKIFRIETKTWEEYFAKYVIVSTWWKSFFQVWTTGDWYNFARNFWINIIPPTRALWWLSTKKDLSSISWISCNVNLEVFDKKKSPLLEKEGARGWFYQETWPILFTHFWISWPIIFNAWNAIWEYLNKSPLLGKERAGEWSEIEVIYEKYLTQNIYIKLNFDLEKTPKNIIKFFELDKKININWTQIYNTEIILDLQNFRSWKEAKATGWWIDLNELDKFLQSKKVPNLFFIWEICDITGKTGGFNLQWAWSSAFCASEFFSRN